MSTTFIPVLTQLEKDVELLLQQPGAKEALLDALLLRAEQIDNGSAWGLYAIEGWTLEDGNSSVVSVMVRWANCNGSNFNREEAVIFLCFLAALVEAGDFVDPGYAILVRD